MTLTMHAFGDSVTVGYSAVANRGYAARVADAKAAALINHAASGHQIPDSAPLVYGVPILPDTVSFWLPGFNDYRWWGQDPLGAATFRGAVLALLAWLAIPEAKKVRGQAAQVAGTWAPTAVYGGALGRYSATQGSTLTFRVRGTAVYLAGIALQSMAGGLLGLKIDGSPVDVCRCLGIAPHNSGIGYAPFLVRVAGLGDGLHVVEASVASPSGNVYVDWCAGNSWATPAGGPRVYVGGALRLPVGGYGTSQLPEFNHGSEEAATSYSRVIKESACALAVDGLRVVYVDTTACYDPDHGDNVPPDPHPNDAGHQHIADAFLAAMG